MADPYRSQVDLNLAPVSGASASEFGAGAAAGLEQLGGSIDNAIHLKRQAERDAQATQAGVDFAQAATDIDKAAIDARSTAAPGGAGHSQAIEQEFDKRSSAELAKITDPHIRDAFKVRYAQLRDNIAGREYGWEASARVDHLTTNFQNMGDTLAAGAASNPDPAGFQVSLDTIATTARSLSVPADIQDKLIKEGQRKVAVAWANSMQDKNPHLLVAALDKGLLNPYLEGNDVNTLRSGGLVEIRRQEAAAQQKLNQATADARENVSLLLNKVRDGYVPTAEEWDQAQVLAKTYDLKGPDWDLGVARDRADVNRETRDWTPAQWRSSINELEAKGDKRTAADSVRLNHLKEAAPGAITRFNSDPFAAAAAAGNPAPEVDWESPDPKAIENRVTWARAYASSTGLQNVPYLSVDEMKALRDRAAQGPAGQLEISGQLRSAFGATVATDIVRQIDPSNKDLRLMVGLHPRVAELYKRGAEALSGKVVQLGSSDQDQAALDRQAINDIFGAYSEAIPTDIQPALRRAAENITAGVAAEFNHHQPSGDELAGTFRSAMQRAGGMLGSPGQGSATGGFANWEGHYVWLPQNMGRDDFQHRLSRAGKEDWTKAAGSAPYYLGSDGKLAPLTDGQIAQLPHYRFETVNPGVYRLVGPDGGHLLTKDGKPFQFDIRNLR